MRIAVIGAGAVGGYCAARLLLAGHAVHVVDLGAHLTAIAVGGLRVITPSGEWVVHPVTAADPTAVGPVDLVIIAVQSQDTAAVARQLRPLLGAHTVVLPLQNNVDNPEKLAAALGANHVLGAAIFIAAARPAPGIVHQLADRVKLTIGELDGHSSVRVRQLAEVLNEAELPCVISPHIRKEMWQKFIFVIGFYLTAPLRATAGEILALAETRSLHGRLLEELVEVAATQGIGLETADVDEVIAATRNYGGYLPSVVQEIDEGRADEAEHMLATAIQLGQVAGRPMTSAMDVLAFTRFFNQRNKRRSENQQDE